MGVKGPLERMIQQVENGVQRADRKVRVDSVEYDAKCYRVGIGGTIRLDLKRTELIAPKHW